MARPDPGQRDQPRPTPAVPVAGNQALTIGPGQTLILSLGRDATPDDVERLGNIKEHLPGVEVLVLGGIEQMAVYDPDRLAAHVAEAVRHEVRDLPEHDVQKISEIVSRYGGSPPRSA